MPDNNKECVQGSKNFDNCILSNKISYGKIIHKLGWIFIPIIMILYLISMTAISYGMVKIKYLIDFKFIDTYIILMILGLIGFLMSTILAVISTFIQCVGKVSNHIEDVCKINFRNKLYFD